MSVTFDAYQPRIVQPKAPLVHEGYRLKTYAIYRKGTVFDPPLFDDGIRLALSALPGPSRTAARPALGFIILHQGKGKNYIVISWWDHENEMPTRVFVNDGVGWKPAGTSDSFCVWDLEVMWYERQTYINTMLSGVTGDEEGYLAFSFKAGSGD